ncbi:MAG: DMT family transporter [Gammaproteobacteria bacterium]|nr:DMT family transporter [Gammaproteobacteria bacterium]
MGEALAVVSMTLFALTNIAVSRGHDGKSRSSGAFLSIAITFLMSGLIWSISVIRAGWPELDREAVAWFALGGFLTIFIGRVFVYASIQHLGAIKASAVKRLNPFFSVLLGVLVLGETISGPMAFGMLLILLSFAVLVRQAVYFAEEGERLADRQSLFRRMANLGYLFGPISAFAYASGYVARKYGMEILPDAAFGTMVGALSGIIFFVLASGFIGSYRDDLKRTFTVFNKWFLAAGIVSSLGQICYFAALKYIGISKIALITSMEVFVTMILSTLVFLSKEKLTIDLIVAACLGFAGTVFVILY